MHHIYIICFRMPVSVLITRLSLASTGALVTKLSGRFSNNSITLAMDKEFATKAHLLFIIQLFTRGEYLLSREKAPVFTRLMSHK